MQAAALGRIDWDGYRPFNRAWQRKLRLQLEYLKHETQQRQRELSVQYHQALLGINRISDESLDKIQQRCRQELRNLQQSLQPWLPAADAEKSQLAAMKGRWERRWGDMTNPETLAKIERVAQALSAMQEVPAETIDRFGVYNRWTASAIEGLPRGAR